MKEKSIRFEYKAIRKDDKKILAEGHTINVFVDAKKMKSALIPEEIKGKIRIDNKD